MRRNTYESEITGAPIRLILRQVFFSKPFLFDRRKLLEDDPSYVISCHLYAVTRYFFQSLSILSGFPSLLQKSGPGVSRICSQLPEPTHRLSPQLACFVQFLLSRAISFEHLA
jgi:hypothetical protein